VVGRKTRRVENVANRLDRSAPALSRAVGVALPNDILEPFRGGNDSGNIRNHVAMPRARNGSKPARMPDSEITFSARRVFRPTDQERWHTLRPIATHPF
jgi:hypothetical protein